MIPTIGEIVNTKYLFRSLDIAYGCKNGGFGEECRNCCALPVMDKISGQDGRSGELARSVIRKENGKTCWNDEIKANPGAYKELLNRINGKKRYYIVCYCSDISLCPEYILEEFFWISLLCRKHSFTLLTKNPTLLYQKVENIFKRFALKGLYSKSFRHIRFAVSIGQNKTLYRLNQIRKFRKLGFKHIDVWFKPLIENINKVDLHGISSIRVNLEKDHGWIRGSVKWMESIIKQAKEQKVKAYFDLEEHQRERIRNGNNT